MKFLISKGANPHQLDFTGHPPIALALGKGIIREDMWRKKNMTEYSEGHLKTIQYLADLVYSKERPCNLEYLYTATQ